MATFKELRDDVKSRLDEESTGNDVMWSDTAINRWLNEANLRLATVLEDLESIDLQNSVASQAAYALPADLVKILRVTHNAVPLRPINFQKLNDFESEANPTTAQTGVPECFYLWGGDIYLFPAPASAVSNGLVLWYYSTPATLSGDSDVPEHDQMLHYLLPLYACYLGYGKDMGMTEGRNAYGLWQEGLQNERERLGVKDRTELGQIMQVD